MSNGFRRTKVWEAVYNAMQQYASSQGECEQMADDALGALPPDDPIQKIIDIASGEVYWLPEGENAQDALGHDIIVQQGYFVAVTE